MTGQTSRLSSRLGRQSFAYGLASLVGPGTGLLLLPVYTRFLEPADYGLIALLEVIALLMTSVFSLGMPAMVPFLYLDYKNADARRRAFGTLVVAVTAVNIVLALVVWLAGPSSLATVLPSVPFAPYVQLVILTTLVEPYWVMAGAALQIQERAGRFAVWSTARIAVSIVTRLLFVVVLLRGAEGFIMANLVTAVIFAAAAFFVLQNELVWRFSPRVLREALRVGSPTVPNNLLSYGFRLMDRVVLERFATLEQVGLYYIALRLADVMRLCGDVFINAWRPIFFKEADRTDFARHDAPRVIRIVVVVLVSLFVVLSVFARDIVTLFAAPAYRGAAHFVPLLVAAMMIKGFQSFPYLVIWLRKKTVWVPALSGLTLVVSLCANWVLAARWGVMGVAAALVVSYGFLAVTMLAVSRRLYSLQYPWRHLTTATALGIATVTVSALLPDGTVSFVLKCGIVACFFLLLVATGCLPRSELRALWSSRAMMLVAQQKATAS
jgi:O-antigen/teichoic acid export membrane protein